MVDSQSPAKKNRPPYIVGSQPTVDTSYYTTADCTQQVFSVTVSDPDIGDQIHSEWFINPIDNFTTQLPNHPTPIQGTTKTVLSGGVRIDSPMTGLDALGQLAQGATDNLLVVVISDGEFVAAGQPSGPDKNGIDVGPHGVFPIADGGCVTGLTTDADAGVCIDQSYVVKAFWRVTPAKCP
ncbi:MAG: hypothetical protein QM723_05470 [Myxococcaceae bacterium]